MTDTTMCMHGGVMTEGGRLDVPPSADARLELPAAFGTRFALFGDAEEEFDWTGPFRREATAVTAMAALPAANARFVAAGVIPCWLADWPVVDDPASADMLRALVAAGECTVGTQLHPWVNPPFDEPVTAANSYTSNLTRGLQAAKLAALTQRIEDAVGVRPDVYRAGRYGVGEHSAALLSLAGYRLDLSVRAGFDYSGQGGPDFAQHPIWPYHVRDDLFALPLTTGFVGALRRWPGLYLAEHVRGTMAKMRLLQRVPLTPEGVPLTDAIAAIDALLAGGHRLFSLSFHTPSLVPGHTPYVRDAADLRTFWAWWDGVFAHFAQQGVEPASSSEIVAAFDAARSGSR